MDEQEKLNKMIEFMKTMNQDVYCYIGLHKDTGQPVCMSNFTDEFKQAIYHRALLEDDFFVELHNVLKEIHAIYETAHAKRLEFKKGMEQQELH